jgi:hypothetical protein
MGRRLENWGATLCIIGLVLWYAGGWRAIFRLVSVQPLLVTSLVFVVLALGIALALERRGLKVAAGAGALLAAGSVLCMWSAVAISNAVFDSSEVELVPSQILSFHKPSKGPWQVKVSWGAARVSLHAEDAPGCVNNQPALLHLKRGALGLAWVSEITCIGKDTQVRDGS